MINDKKIEDAAKQHSEESYISDYFQACYKDAFMEGTKWAINEFLKDLWHPVSEEPKKGRVFLYKTIFKGYGLNKIIDRIPETNFQTFIFVTPNKLLLFCRESNSITLNRIHKVFVDNLEFQFNFINTSNIIFF